MLSSHIHTKPDLEFSYGPDGNRISKTVKPRDATGALLPASQWITTYYVLDASGNQMATYTIVGESLKWQSSSLYGSSRLGS